jgi:hypothetical protein
VGGGGGPTVTSPVSNVNWNQLINGLTGQFQAIAVGQSAQGPFLTNLAGHLSPTWISRLQRSLNLDSNSNMGASLRTLQLGGNASCVFGRSPHTAVLPTLIQFTLKYRF